MRLTGAKLRRLKTEAREYFEPYGIDFSLYHPPVVRFLDITCIIRWRHRHNNCILQLSSVYYSDETGDILQGDAELS